MISAKIYRWGQFEHTNRCRTVLAACMHKDLKYYKTMFLGLNQVYFSWMIYKYTNITTKLNLN